MADGRVVINVNVNDRELEESIEHLDNFSRNTDKSTNSIKNFSLAMLATKGIEKVFQAIGNSIGGAVERFDILNRYPRILEQMGYSADISQKSMNKLVNGIQGLPTTLQEVVQTAQGLTTMTGDIELATDLTLALNNAFLASGASAGDASRGMTQYTQMLATGKVDMQSWRTLQETMTLSLNEIAESFGYTGPKAMNEFYEALRDGDLSMQDFNDRLIELSEKQGGFADIALSATEGIGTSFQNIKTAFVTGTEGILSTINEMLENATGNNIAQTLDNFKFLIKDAFDVINEVLMASEPIFSTIINILGWGAEVLAEYPEILAGVVAGFVALQIIKNIDSITQGFSSTLGKLKGGFTNLLSPTNLIVAGFGALVAGVIYLYKEFNKLDESIEKNAENISELKNRTNDMREQSESSARAFERSRQEIKKSSDEIDELISSTFALANEQNRTAEQTKELKENVATLNEYFGDEVIALDESNGRLNVRAEELKQLNELTEKQNELDLARERVIELQAEEAEQQELLLELDKARHEANEAFWEKENEQHGIFWQNSNERRALLENASESIDVYEKQLKTTRDTEEALSEAKDMVAESILGVKEAEERLVKTRDESTHRAINSLDELNSKEREVANKLVEYRNQIEEATLNMFSKIETESELTWRDMQKNLEHNISAVQNWAENLDSLAEKGINKGLLERLRKAGPSSASHVKALDEMTEDEVAEFNKTLEKAGDTLEPALTKAYGLAEESLPENMMSLITKTETTLEDEIKAVGWSKHGQKITDGLSKGIKQGQAKVSDELYDLAKGGEDEFLVAIDAHSPSRKYRKFGRWIGDGLALGIDDRKKKVTNSLSSLVSGMNSGMQVDLEKFKQEMLNQLNSVLTPVFNAGRDIRQSLANALGNTYSIGDNFAQGTINGMNKLNSHKTTAFNTGRDIRQSLSNGLGSTYRIGVNFAQGIINGMNAMRTKVYNAGWNLGQRADLGTKNYLAIRSPSRKGLETGENYGGSVGMGIDKQKDFVERKGKELAQVAVQPIDFNDFVNQSNLGLNASRQALSSSYREVVTHNNTTNNHTVPNITMNVEWKGKEDIRDTMAEMGFITSQERLRLT